MRTGIGTRPVTFAAFFVLLFASVGLCADPEPSDNGAGAADRQLQINKNVLLDGPNQQTRDFAAMELLVSEDKAARQILIECMTANDNRPAIRAICRGLIDSRTQNQPIDDKFDFLEPLVGILKNAEAKDAELAAEALLIFDFADVSQTLRTMAMSADNPKQARLNAIYAIALRPADKDAIAELVGMLDDVDSQIAEAASAALPYWIPKGMDHDEILKDLKRKSQEQIIRDRMVYLEEQLRKVSAERDQWVGLYVSSMDRTYESSDENSKAELLFDNLEKTRSPVLKIWALNKILLQSGNVAMPEGFSDRLISLIADSDKEVRLAVANVLTKMSNLSGPERLLEQLKSESDENVRLAMFEALGEACYYSLLSSTQENALPDQIRNDTLSEADKYLDSDDAVKSKMGAVVIRKLIEPNGMNKELVSVHLEKILVRYERSDGQLKADLLNVMAKISGQNANRSAAGKLYRQAFVAGLDGKGDSLLKQAAVVGLTNIDKASAKELFVRTGLYDDGNPAVVSMVIQLAGEVGQSGDLNWLVKKLDSNGNAEAIWQSMRQILLRQNADVIVEWAEKLAAGKTSPERIRELIEIAEQKAAGQANNKKIADKLDNELVPSLVEVYLQNADWVRVTQVVSKRLTGLKDDDKALAKIDGYLNLPAIKTEDKKTLFEALAAIKVQMPEDAARIWQAKLWSWNEKFTAVTEPANTAEQTQPQVQTQPVGAEGRQ